MLALAYQLFAVLCGWLEAILYAKRGAEAFSGNEHEGMNYQRLAAWLLVPVALLAYRWLGWWVLAELVPAALLFPLFHDEAYNFTRLWITWAERLGQSYSWAGQPVPLDIDRQAFRAARVHYTYGYQSPTTTARNDFNGRQRTWLAAAGCLLLVVGYWLLLKN